MLCICFREYGTILQFGRGKVTHRWMEIGAYDWWIVESVGWIRPYQPIG